MVMITRVYKMVVITLVPKMVVITLMHEMVIITLVYFFGDENCVLYMVIFTLLN